MHRRSVSPFLIGLAAIVAASCTTITEELPERTVVSPVVVTPIPVIVVPVPLPSANPAPAPNPQPPANPTPGNPAPTPVPTSTPNPAPPSASCSLGPGGGSGSNCPRTGASFLGEVDQAINQVVRNQPGMFDLNDQRGSGGYFIRNIDGFLNAVVGNLRAMGLCAIVDRNGEIAVKDTNGFSDQYDLVLSSGHIFRGNGSYAATCRPAWF